MGHGSWCSKCCQLFRVFFGRALFEQGVMHLYYLVDPSRQEEMLMWLHRRAGSSRASWRIHPLVKKTLHSHRAESEPLRPSPLKKRLKAPQVLGEATSACTEILHFVLSFTLLVMLRTVTAAIIFFVLR
jgi:hypothetical protein